MKTIKSLLFILLISAPTILMAHPPKSIDIKYSPDQKKLTAEIPHGVKDVKDHYIKTIVISVDGKEVKTIDLKEQTSKEKENIDIELPDIKSGSEISIKATCNKFGSKSGIIKVK